MSRKDSLATQQGMLCRLPLVIQLVLGSLAGSCSDLSGPPNQLWPAATSCSFPDIFFKFSGANCQEHSVQRHNLTAELSPFPEKYFLPDLFVAGLVGTLVLGEESYAGSQGFGISWAHVPQGGQSWVERVLPSSGSRAAKQELAGRLVWLYWDVARGWSREPPGSSQRSALAFGEVGSTAWQG